MGLRRDLALVVTSMVALAGCEQRDALRYIPATDRALLQAEARLGAGAGGAPQRMSVEALLAQARGGTEAAAAPAPASGQSLALTLRFAPGAVQPDAAQRAAVARFAAAAQGAARLQVSARPGPEQGPELLLGQRRAVAVARLLEDAAPEVALRFDAAVPADAVLLAAEGPGR